MANTFGFLDINDDHETLCSHHSAAPESLLQGELRTISDPEAAGDTERPRRHVAEGAMISNSDDSNHYASFATTALDPRSCGTDSILGKRAVHAHPNSSPRGRKAYSQGRWTAATDDIIQR